MQRNWHATLGTSISAARQVWADDWKTLQLPAVDSFLNPFSSILSFLSPGILLDLTCEKNGVGRRCESVLYCNQGPLSSDVQSTTPPKIYRLLSGKKCPCHHRTYWILLNFFHKSLQTSGILTHRSVCPLLQVLRKEEERIECII